MNEIRCAWKDEFIIFHSQATDARPIKLYIEKYRREYERRRWFWIVVIFSAFCIRFTSHTNIHTYVDGVSSGNASIRPTSEFYCGVRVCQWQSLWTHKQSAEQSRAVQLIWMNDIHTKENNNIVRSSSLFEMHWHYKVKPSYIARVLMLLQLLLLQIPSIWSRIPL